MEGYTPSGGQFSVGGHGLVDPAGNVLNLISDDRTSMDHKTLLDAIALADMIQNHSDYNKGDDIYLASCNAGTGDNSLAQQLADILNVNVWAPPGEIWPKTIEYDGNLNPINTTWGGAPFVRFQ